MLDPEKLLNNVLLRGLVARAGFMGSREIIRRTLVHLLLTPARRRRLGIRVAGYFRSYFPELDEDAVQRRVASYLEHYGRKMAEDTVTVNLSGIEAHLRAINSHVVVRGGDNLRRALDRGRGVVAVGSHVGSVTFGTTAFISLYLTLPEERYPVTRLCTEPDVIRFPTVLSRLEEVLQDYRADVQFLLTRRERRSIAEEITETLDRGGLVTSNLDVLMGGSSQKVFGLFEGQARVHLPALVGAAKSALRTGATILPWINVRTSAGYRLVLEDPLEPVARLGQKAHDDHPEVKALCETLRRILERWITTYPDQWFYWDRLHRRLVA